jgi:hypothetical protein
VKTVRLSDALRSEIYRSARAQCSGTNPLFEAAFYSVGDRMTSNKRIWGTAEWGGDLCRLAGLREIDLDEQGLCTLDLYATTTHSGTRELERNVYVTIDSERVVFVTSDDFRPFGPTKGSN